MADSLDPRSTIVDTGTRRLHVASWGDPTAPVVVLQHGMRDHVRSWDWIAQRLAERFHVLAPDLRGRGEPLPPNERLALLRNRRIVTFPDVSLWLHHHARDAFARELESFLHSSIESPFYA